ncbi:hypothetical protein [Photobacterium leiognathi]|uniref:hypothetical protein n=1 Tax=Photobacterium leiognathi TaxID=553611 RepID=UPI00273A378A|nr:hypothetical protein [Photobacterium leiognathi]
MNNVLVFKGMAEINKWRNFYLLEEEFLKWLDENGVSLANDSDSTTYIEKMVQGVRLTKPPKYIRQVLNLNHDCYEEAQTRFADVRQAFIDAKHDDGIDDESKIRFPDRFPIFIDSAASQINIIKNAAYKSKVLKRNDTQLTLFKCNVEAEHLALDMFDKISAVYPSAEIFRSLLSKTISISINGNDVLDKFDASEITMREYTGTQYRAKIVFDDERESEREKYGFLIVPHSVAIFDTVPQKRRNDAYKKEDRLHAPFIHYDLYKKM